MLAYIFWHWPRSESGYEAALMAFHEALWSHPPPGFLGSRVMRVGPRPWLEVPSAYEDWYFVEDFAALGTLNDAAISGREKRLTTQSRRWRSGAPGHCMHASKAPSLAHALRRFDRNHRRSRMRHSLLRCRPMRRLGNDRWCSVLRLSFAFSPITPSAIR